MVNFFDETNPLTNKGTNRSLEGFQAIREVAIEVMLRCPTHLVTEFYIPVLSLLLSVHVGVFDGHNNKSLFRSQLPMTAISVTELAILSANRPNMLLRSRTPGFLLKHHCRLHTTFNERNRIRRSILAGIELRSEFSLNF